MVERVREAVTGTDAEDEGLDTMKPSVTGLDLLCLGRRLRDSLHG